MATDRPDRGRARPHPGAQRAGAGTAGPLARAACAPPADPPLAVGQRRHAARARDHRQWRRGRGHGRRPLHPARIARLLGRVPVARRRGHVHLPLGLPALRSRRVRALPCAARATSVAERHRSATADRRFRLRSPAGASALGLRQAEIHRHHFQGSRLPAGIPDQSADAHAPWLVRAPPADRVPPARTPAALPGRDSAARH